MKRKIINFIFCVLLINVEVKSQTNLNLNVVSFSGDTINLISILPENCIIILHKNPSCTACKKELCKFLDYSIDTSKIKIIAITKMHYFPASFWETDSYLKNLCPKISTTYFDVTNYSKLKSDTIQDINIGIFEYNKISHCPALILKKKNKSKVLKYEEIFSEYFVDKITIKNIKQFFKKLIK
jgi:hypothetical protein